MPFIQGQHLREILPAAFGMYIAFVKILFREGFEQGDPSRMKGGNKIERYRHRKPSGIGKIGPCGFIVGLDDGPVFGDRQFHPDVGICMAVSDMMYYLANGPASITIRGVELVIVEADNSGGKTLRQES